MQDIENIEPGSTKTHKEFHRIHKEFITKGGPTPDPKREWVPGFTPNKEEGCQSCRFYLWNLAVKVRKAENILIMERLIKQREGAPSKRQKKKITKIIKKKPSSQKPKIRESC